jgi:hypothetical protein
MVSCVLGVDEVFGTSILGGGERWNVEAWVPHSPEACNREGHKRLPGPPSDFCLMNAISQADSDLALKRNHFMNV